MNIAVFASHSGTGLQAVIDACANGCVDGCVCMVVSNNRDAVALERAKNNHIPHYHISERSVPDEDKRNRAILDALTKNRADIILLMGYLKKIGKPVLYAYKNCIFNIHPALLPKYGGRGMYGMHVHRAVINAGETISGVTVHRVNEEYDEGDIVAQVTLPVYKDDTPEILAERVLRREHTFIIDVINEYLTLK